MMNDTVKKALSQQVNMEFHSSYIYLGMSTYFSDLSFPGLAHWMYIQAQEEMAHATHLYKYILDRGETPTLPAIGEVTTQYKSVQDAFETTLQHERLVTASINKIASLAMQEADHATYQFLQWYINEQVEEEDTANTILQKVKNIGSDNGLLYMLDQELAARTFVHPFPNDAI